MHYSGQLHNHLDPSCQNSDEEFEYMRSDYKNGDKSGGKQGKFARGAGLIILLLAIMFVVQRFLFPFGPDLTSVLRLIPVTGVILVLVIGLGLLSRSRSERRRASDSEWRLKNEEATPGGTEYYTSSAAGSSGNADSGTDPSSGPHAGSDFHSFAETGTGAHSRSPSGTYTGSREAGEGTNEGASKTSEKNSRKHDSGESGDDPYGFEMHRKWYRSREDKMLFGVCGGIAERLDMDPTIVRALFALAFLSYGFSLVIYVILAVVLPKKPQHSLL